MQDRMDAEASLPLPAHTTTPVPSVRPSSATATPLPAEPREPELPPVTPAFTPNLNPASKPSFTPAPGANPDFGSGKPHETAATKPSGKKEAPSMVSRPELKTPAFGSGVPKELKPSPFAKKAAPAAKESLMSSLSSAQKQQAAAAAGGLKRKGLQSSMMSNVAKAPRK